MARSVVAINAQGRLTLPADVRRKLGLSEGSQLEVAVENDRVTLRPATLVVAEDAWAYGREHLASVKRALADVRAGRVYRMSEAQLLTSEAPRQSVRRRKRARA